MAAKYEVYILNQQMKPLAVLDTETFVRWTRRWQGCDDFELKINKKDPRVQYLVEDNVLQIRRGSDAEFTCLIEHGGIELDQNGRASENWEIRGTEITSRRICLPTVGQAHHEITGPAETIMKALVDANLVTAADTARRVSLLSVENDAGQGASLTVRARYQTLPDKLEEAALAGGVGWGVVGTSTGLQFRLIKGTDRSTAQAINPPIIFAPDFGNLEEMSYQWSNVGRPSIAYVAGQGEGANRTVREVFLGGEEPSGLSRREDFVDARDLSTADALDDRGAAKLGEFGPKDRLEAKILNLGPFSYRDDWDLGDIVTVRNSEWGILSHLRVAEVTVCLSSGQPEEISVSFGAAVRGFTEVIKSEISQSSTVQTSEPAPPPDVSIYAPKASPVFTGVVTLPSKYKDISSFIAEGTFSLTHGLANQAVLCVFPVGVSNYLFGSVEIEITSSIENASALGKMKKVFSVGWTPDGTNHSTEKPQYTEIVGEISNQFHIGNAYWNGVSGAGSAWFIPVYKTTTAGNPVTITVRVLAAEGYVNALVSGFYFSVATTAPDGVAGLGTVWQDLSLGANWSHYGGEYGNAQFKKVGNLVYIRGLVNCSGAWDSNIVIGTLPSGYRPAQKLICAQFGNACVQRVDVAQNGEILILATQRVGTGNSAWLSLANIVFSTT